MPTLLNRTIRLFLDSIGRKEEYEFYLRKFNRDGIPAFALICPEGDSFEETASVFSFDLAALLRLELHPAILLCGEHAERMQHLLEKEPELYAFHKWTPTGSNLDECLKEAAAFLDTCVEESRIGTLCAANQELPDVLLSVIPALSRRVHFIRPEGGLHTTADAPLHYVLLNRLRDLSLSPKDRDMTELAKTIIEQRPGTHISVCSPWDLLQELFTVEGAGCVIRRGSDIVRHCPPDTVDFSRLMQLLENSFRRTPKADRIREALADVYVEAGYRGAILLEQHAAGMYLSKFAVGTEARGEGLSNELWREVIRDHDALFWRSRVDNPINQWYERQSNGSHQEGRWRVFWRNVHANALPDIIGFCLNRPDDFLPPSPVA